MASGATAGYRAASRWTTCSMIVCSLNSITTIDSHSVHFLVNWK
jgi:hypothetical protein